MFQISYASIEIILLINAALLLSVSVLISLESNPQTFADFSNGTAQAPYVKDFFQIPSGPACFFVDIATALSDQTIANGTEATLMVRYGGGDGDLFQVSWQSLLSNNIRAPIKSL